MVFNSYIFVLFFLPVVVAVYYILNQLRQYKLAVWFVTGMSLAFYGYANIAYLLLLLVSIAVNYLLTRVIFRMRGTMVRKGLLSFGLIFNIGLLVYFKYYDFFVESLNEAFGSSFMLHRLLLPLAISFYTFQHVAYLVDCYRQKIPEYTLTNYVFYMTFFPKLMQGPIVLPEELISQVEDEGRKKADYDFLFSGIYAFTMGLAKKVLIADTLAKFANAGFAGYSEMDATNTLIAMLCYTLQIYFDFSGYSDMAIGIGRLFGIELPVNFHSPYRSASITEFWERWHMTLTRFFTRYLYIPLGGSRKGTFRTYLNNMIVFVISGLWHGANWTFIIWGAFNGILVVCNKAGKKIWDKVPQLIGIPVTFVITMFLWTFFRADTAAQAVSMIRNVFTGAFGDISTAYTDLMNTLVEIRILGRFGLQGLMDSVPALPFAVFVAVILICVWFCRNTQEKMQRLVPGFRKITIMVLLMTWSILSLSELSQFVYVNF